LNIGLKLGVGWKKKTKNLKKSYKMAKKRGKKEKNEEKLKKMMQKDVLWAVCFQNRTKMPRGPLLLAKVVTARG